MPKRPKISMKTKVQVLKRQRGYCAGEHCAKLHHGRKIMQIDLSTSHFDHKRPIAMLGKNIPSNIQALCPTCHMEKTRADRVRIKKWKLTHPTCKRCKKIFKKLKTEPFEYCKPCWCYIQGIYNPRPNSNINVPMKFPKELVKINPR